MDDQPQKPIPAELPHQDGEVALSLYQVDLLRDVLKQHPALAVEEALERRAGAPPDPVSARRRRFVFDSYPSTALIAAPCPFRPASSRPANRDTVPQVFNGRINGRFAPGYSGNPGGSPDRARKALNAETIAELHRAFRIGGRQAINKVMRNQPAVFLKLLVLLVPREMKVEQSGGVKEMTDEQIERGIELIKEILAQREAAANAKVVEGTAETVALPAPYVVPDGPNKVMDVADTAVGARERKPRKRKVPSPTSVIS